MDGLTRNIMVDKHFRQPFGQIPTYEDGAVTLFETGAIVLHVAERFGGLLPEGAARGA